jgi:dipeptidyl aminopeptidase/acylaminoacyl peptidase
MERDIRGTTLYREAESLFRTLRAPGSGQISDAVEASASPDGKLAIFTGLLVDSLEGPPQSRICVADLTTGNVQLMTFGPRTDRLAKYSPDGRCVAFLSDRQKTGDFQLYLLDPTGGAARAAPSLDGWVEYFHWSPDGKRILLGVAGHGADVSSGQGAIPSETVAQQLPAWMPTLDSGDESYRWRRAWVYELATGHVRQVSPEDVNVWEAAWCGNGAIAAVISNAPGEGLWYSARLSLVDVDTGQRRGIDSPAHQIGWPAASPSGRQLAFVIALCSDRGFVAGDLHLADVASGATIRVDTHGVDVSCLEWRSDRTLLLAGHRGFATVVACYDTVADRFEQTWSSEELTTSGLYASVSGFGEQGDCVLVSEGFTRAPEIAVIQAGEYRTVKSFAAHGACVGPVSVNVERLTWRAPDGLEIQGWLLHPGGAAPRPLVMSVHGGPVWHWRPRWLGRVHVSLLMLIAHGYAVFLPNPRGSDGRGQDFVQHVLGDMGGADTLDLLSGLDSLVARGIADPGRLGVMGVSYGGFMAAWLIAQDSRFAAAIPIAPFTNQVTQHLLSNIPHFVALFLGDSYHNPGGKYFERSPVMHAHKARTPTLNVCGALDRSAPPGEALQFHNALLENGVESVLLTYPQEGHGIRQNPAALDFAARVVSWFEEHL